MSIGDFELGGKLIGPVWGRCCTGTTVKGKAIKTKVLSLFVLKSTHKQFVLHILQQVLQKLKRLQHTLCLAKVAPEKNPPYQSHLALHPIQTPLYLI